MASGFNWARVATQTRLSKYGSESYGVTKDKGKRVGALFRRRKARRVNFTRRLTREEELAQIAAFTPKNRTP